MPKDEFDFEDPFELNGMAFLSHEDTTNDMAECFTEEFMRMGYSHQQVLALFRNPHYLGPNMAFEKRGEPFIRDLIADVFARWGKVVTWPDAKPCPLTPALSSSEGARENPSPANCEPVTADCRSDLGLSEKRQPLFPRPLGGGEGQGEGVGGEHLSTAPAQVSKPGTTLTDPTGAPIPEYTV
jgi:hypothetical protein